MNQYLDDDQNDMFEDQRVALAYMDRKPQQTWFDNKRPVVRQFNANRYVATVKKRYEDMTLDELKEVLSISRQTLQEQYNQHKLMPEIGLKEHIHKTSYRVSLLLVHIRKLEPDFEYGEVKSIIQRESKQSSAKTSKLISELTELRGTLSKKNAQIKELNQYKVKCTQLESELQKPIKKNEKMERHLKVMSKFEELVKSQIGEKECFELIKLADKLVDM